LNDHHTNQVVNAHEYHVNIKSHHVTALTTQDDDSYFSSANIAQATADAALMKSGAAARYAFDTGMAATEKQLTIDLGQKFRLGGTVTDAKSRVALASCQCFGSLF